MQIQEARLETKMVGTTVYAKKVQEDNQICATADTAKKLDSRGLQSTLDLQCRYWQVPFNPEDRGKTAFYPGSDTRLFQFG